MEQLDMWQKLAFTLVLVSSFVLLYQSKKFRAMAGNLRFYGKMSLTNYITQSIIGAIIYFPIGFYLAPYCGYTISLIIGICTFLMQVQFCKWWLGKHKQGPLEHIWHKWTWKMDMDRNWQISPIKLVDEAKKGRTYLLLRPFCLIVFIVSSELLRLQMLSSPD